MTEKILFLQQWYFLPDILFIHSDVPLKQKANGFLFQILLGNRSVHVRHSENLRIMSWSFLFSRHVPCIISVVCVYISEKRK